MGAVIEPASSGRAKCRGCGRPIAKGELRLGDRQPNPFADDAEMTLWFHLVCGAFKRPEPMLEALGATEADVDRAEWLAAEAKRGAEHRRIPRIDGVQRSPTGRASCRSCHEPIGKDTWRIKLVFFDQGRFDPAGFVHLGCAEAHFGSRDVLDRLRQFSPELSEEDAGEIEALLACPPDED